MMTPPKQPSPLSRLGVAMLALAAWAQVALAAENAGTQAHPFLIVEPVEAFQQAAAFIEHARRPATNAASPCIGIPREGFRNNPAWLTRSEHEAAAELRQKLFNKFEFTSSQSSFAAHGRSPWTRWPNDLGANLGINAFCDGQSELGQLWNWARIIAANASTSPSGFTAHARLARTPSGLGFWTVTPDGRVFSYGDARHFGSVLGNAPGTPIVAMAARPQGDGYWMTTGEGEVFAFGQAGLHGSLTGHSINRPIVGICPTAKGDGYWLVARDGGVFSFQAPFCGSVGGSGVAGIVGMTATPNNGYWLLGSDGEVFAFNAPFKGSMSGHGLNDFAGIVGKADGTGYWLIRENGAVYTFNVGNHNGLDSTLPSMTTLLRKSSLQAYATTDQIRQYHARTWQSDDGLPHNAVPCLAQTRDGYVWAGSVEGLSRFDGVHFSKLSDPGLAALQNGSITALAAGSDGSLWVGVDGVGLLRRKEGSFLHYSRTNGLMSDRVRAILCASDGTVWVGTAEGLHHLRDNTIKTYTRTNGFLSDSIISLCEDGNGRVWAGTGQGAHCVAGGRVVTVITEGLPSLVVRSLTVDKAGNLWIGSSGGLTRVREGKFTTFTRHDGLLENSVSALHEDRKGNLWIGTLGGLNRLAGGRIITETADTGAFYDWVFGIIEDLEGNVWVAAKNGLSRLAPKRFTTYTRAHGLAHNSVISVCEDRAGTLWIGTWGGGLAQMKDGKFSGFNYPECAANGLVLGLHLSRDGSIWMGMDFDGGLVHWKEGVCKRFRSEDGLIDPAIAVIHEDQRGSLWLGTRSALVLFKDGKFQRFTGEDGLAGINVKAIYEDRQGALWFGTTNGLSRWQDGRFSNFGVREGLSNPRVNALRGDREGNLWVGTVGGGLNRFKNGRFAAYTTAEGLFHDTIFEILEDRRGYFYLTCPKGVFRIRERDLDEFDRGKIKRIDCVSFGKADGMMSIQCHGVGKPAGWLAQDGRIWVPTATGLVSAEPDIRVNITPPPVIVERLIADKQLVPTREAGPVTGKGGQYASRDLATVTLAPGRGELEIHYTALSYQSPEKNRFKYKLEGIDSDWVDAGSRRAAFYNNVPPGQYRFRVLASNSDGIWNEAGASVPLVWRPHFWQTWWFKLGLGVAGGGLLGLLYQMRMAQVRKIEQLRIRIAADLHDEVGSSLWSISLLSGLLQKNESLAQDDRKDVGEINRIARQTANAVRDIVWFIKPEYDTMEDMVLRMRDVAGTLLGGTGHSFKNVQSDMSRRLPINFRQNVFLMYKEILTNVARHSQATFVEIEILETEGLWELRVRDNGVGFDAQAAHQGSGLKNLRSRAEKVGGTLEVKSERGRGSEFLFARRG